LEGVPAPWGLSGGAAMVGETYVGVNGVDVLLVI
jgi:hypothetical protein